MLLQGHASILICTLTAFILYFLHIKNIFLVIPKPFILIPSFIIFYFTIEYIVEINSFLSNYFDQFASRSNQNIFRYYYLERDSSGYGFIHQSADISLRLQAYSLSRYDSLIYTMDDGYVNIAILFGSFTGALYLTFFLWLILSLLSNINGTIVVIWYYILLFFVANLSYSLFSYSFGFYAIASSIIFMTLLNKSSNNEEKKDIQIKHKV